MNVELAQQALEAARANRDRFNMSTWYSPADLASADDAPHVTIGEDLRIPVCGTVACYAGFVTFMTAPPGTVIVDGGWLYDDPVSANYDCPKDHAEQYAAQQLGITTDQADALFHLKTLEEVEQAVKFLTANPDATGLKVARAAQGYVDAED